METYIQNIKKRIEFGREVTKKYVIPTCQKYLDDLRLGINCGIQIDNFSTDGKQWHLVPAIEGLVLINPKPGCKFMVSRNVPGLPLPERKNDVEQAISCADAKLLPYTPELRAKFATMYTEIGTLFDMINNVFKNMEKPRGVSMADLRFAATRDLTDQIRLIITTCYCITAGMDSRKIDGFEIPICYYQHLLYKLDATTLTIGAMYRDNDVDKFMAISPAKYFNFSEKMFGTIKARVATNVMTYNDGYASMLFKYNSVMIDFGNPAREEGDRVEVTNKMESVVGVLPEWDS